MARIARTTRTAAAPPATPRPHGRPPGSTSATPTKSKAAAPKRATKATPRTAPLKHARTGTPKLAAAPTPKLSRDELRAQVEKLERSIATLRAKNREATRAAKTSAARVEELGKEVARLQRAASKRTVPQEPAASVGSIPPARGRGRRLSRELDPGDAVPPGVAVAEPEPLDEEAATARENLETHLGQDA